MIVSQITGEEPAEFVKEEFPNILCVKFCQLDATGEVIETTMYVHGELKKI